MTVSANPTPDFQRDQLLVAAYGVCGLIPTGTPGGSEITPDQAARGATLLNLVLDELQADGVVLTSAVRTTLALVSGTAEYTLESDTIDVRVDGDDTVGTIIPATSGDAETIVRSMSDNEYLKIATKTTLTGRPSRCFIDKAGTVLKAVFWPVPNSSLISFRYTKIRLLRAGDTGSTTLELRRIWCPYVMWATAAGIAYDNSKPELGAAFDKKADILRERVKGQDFQRVAVRFRVGHSGRNW